MSFCSQTPNQKDRFTWGKVAGSPLPEELDDIAPGSNLETRRIANPRYQWKLTGFFPQNTRKISEMCKQCRLEMYLQILLDVKQHVILSFRCGRWFDKRPILAWLFQLNQQTSNHPKLLLIMRKRSLTHKSRSVTWLWKCWPGTLRFSGYEPTGLDSTASSTQWCCWRLRWNGSSWASSRCFFGDCGPGDRPTCCFSRWISQCSWCD